MPVGASVDPPGEEHRRPAGPGRQPLSLLRDQPGAGIRPRRAPSACISTSRREPPSASSPGEEKEVQLTAFGGTRRASGLNGLTDGSVRSEASKAAALRRAREPRLQGSLTPWPE